MKITFVGRGVRGRICLGELMIHKKNIIEVITQEDEVMRQLAIKNHIPFTSTSSINTLHLRNTDLIVVANFPQIFKKKLLLFPKHGVINLHGGYLPKYRGGSPLNWAIINGEKETGVSVIQMDEGLDTGDILAQEKFRITKTDTIREVHKKANKLFKKLLIKVINDFENGTVTRKKQDESKATYYPQREPRDGFINYKTMSKKQIYNLVRAITHPYHGAFTYVHGKKRYVWRTKK